MAVGSLNRRVRYDTNVSGFAAIQSDDLQVEYQAIRESVVRHRLPKDLKFSGSMKGIKVQSKDMVKNLISSGKYIEMALKVTSNIQASKDIAGYDPYHDIDDLLICLITHMRVIQEEYCMLAIGGSYGPRTQQIFRTIHNNPSQFTPNVIEELKCSATLAALPQKQGQQTTGFRRENTFGRPFQRQNFRGRGRGFSSFGQNFNSSMSGHNENNYGFRARQVPNERITHED